MGEQTLDAGKKFFRAPPQALGSEAERSILENG